MDGIAQDLPANAHSDAREPATPARTERDAAFAALVGRQARFLYRVAFGLLKNTEDAEDAVQETLLKLYRHDAWQGMNDERAFLARAVWRTGLDRLTSSNARAMQHAEDVADLDLASPDASPEEQALGASARAVMKSLIDALPESLRHPLVLCAIDGIDTKQVAAILNIPEGTVRTRTMRARQELRRRFLAQSRQTAEVRP